MNAYTGEWQLQRIILRYSETAGASLGVRFNLAHLLPRWKMRNPQVEVITQHSQFEHPEMTCHFRTGEACTVSLKNVSAKQVEEFMDLYRNSESPNLFLKHGGPRVWTERRSIQGLWQPSFELMANVLKWAHKRDRKKMQRLYYSDYSLRLSKQAQGGHGRWGDESVARRGFDRDVLRAVFAQPFLRPETSSGSSLSHESPKETKDPLPVRAIQAIHGHISDAPSEKHRSLISTASRKLETIQRRLIRLKRERRDERRQARYENEDIENTGSFGSGSGQNSKFSEEETAQWKKNLNEERRMQRRARRATQKMMEEKLAANS